MRHFCPLDISSDKRMLKKMLECIRFGDCKVKTIQIGNEWFVAVRDIGIALAVSSDTLKGIVRNHLTQPYKFSRKEIGYTRFDAS